MKRVFWFWLAVLPLLGLGAWHGAAHVAANAGPAGEKFDCCLDPDCPPGCSLECPPDCLDFTTTARKAEKSACCPSCAGRGTGVISADAAKTSVQKKITCPECPFCPEW
jgi:hypothetical protein